MTTGSVLAQFTITLSQAAAEPVAVDWHTSDGTAVAGVDYAPGNGVALFAPGELSKVVEILVYGRAAGSEDRSFFIEMLPPVNAILGASIGECIIHVDTTGSTPVTQVIVPTGPRGAQGKSAYQVWLDLGNTGTEQDFIDSLSPSAQEIAQDVAPLIDVGNTTLTAEGTNVLSKPDETTVKAVARRVAYVGAAKIATVVLAGGDNLIGQSDLTGDVVDMSSIGLYPRIMRGENIVSPDWSVESDGSLLIKDAIAGDILYVCQYDTLSGHAVMLRLSHQEESFRAELLSPSGGGLVGGTITPITAEFLAGGAVSGQDSTSAVEAAGSIGGTYYVPKGEYIISSAKITKNTVFVFESGASFKRAPGLDVRQSYWNDGVPMIDAAADGLTITFIDPVFDGNKDSQPAVQVGYSGPDATTEPSGWAFRYYPRNPATAKNCRFVFVRPEFKNGTSGYILVRGDDVNRRFKTEVFLDSPIFKDTIYGYGKGDPVTPSALGYSPDYVQVIDYVTVNGRDVEMSYSAVPTPTGRYAPVGIRATYIGGGTPSSAGGPSVNLFGQTTIRGIGRKGNYYDDSSFLNNGIGAIDGYGNADSIYVENIVADDCEAQPVRAKASISRFEVNTAKLKNCRGGTQVSPSTTGETEAIVVIGTVEAEGGWNPAVEVVGTDASQLIPSVSIGTVNCKGGVNGDGRADNTVAGIFVRYCDDVYADRLVAENQDKSGIQFRDNQFVKVNYYRTSGTALEGFKSESTVRSLVVSSGQSRDAGGIGCSVSGATYNVKISDVYTDGVKDYGIFINTTSENCEVDHCTAREVSGLSRGFHLAGPGTISNSKTGSGVTTPASGNLFAINQINNSWSPRSNMINAGSGAPTLGDFRKGDRIYSAPAAGGYVGWVCTVAGIAGSTAVFKRFGAIEV